MTLIAASPMNTAPGVPPDTCSQISFAARTPSRMRPDLWRPAPSRQPRHAGEGTVQHARGADIPIDPGREEVQADVHRHRRADQQPGPLAARYDSTTEPPDQDPRGCVEHPVRQAEMNKVRCRESPGLPVRDRLALVLEPGIDVRCQRAEQREGSGNLGTSTPAVSRRDYATNPSQRRMYWIIAAPRPSSSKVLRRHRRRARVKGRIAGDLQGKSWCRTAARPMTTKSRRPSGNACHSGHRRSSGGADLRAARSSSVKYESRLRP